MSDLDFSRAEECWEAATAGGDASSGLWAVAAALFSVAGNISYAARHLGTGNAATQMGAIEALSVSVEKIAEAISDHK